MVPGDSRKEIPSMIRRVPDRDDREPATYGFGTGGSRWGRDTVGLHASVIGIVLVGCTAVGFGAGWWLDQKFGTSFWMPVLSMVGVAAGFRQMFVTLAD